MVRGTVPERLAKVIARSGLCSRREAERWILDGRVTVNGIIASSPAFNVSLNDRVEVDGESLPSVTQPRVWLYYKPCGLITTHHDPQGRPTVFETLPESIGRVISIGRLDLNSEGLLLLTNDGGLAKEMMHPRKGWVRTYRVRVYGEVDENALKALRRGITIQDPKTRQPVTYGPIEARVEKRSGRNSWLVVSLTEGKNREIRNIGAHLGLQVNRLIRVAYGPFEVGDLKPGEIREVSVPIIKH